MSTAVKLASRDARSIPFQEASLDIWDKKYRLSAKDGTPLDRTMDDTYKRVARALADVEREPIREHWYERFLWALRRGARRTPFMAFEPGWRPEGLMLDTAR